MDYGFGHEAILIRFEASPMLVEQIKALNGRGLLGSQNAKICLYNTAKQHLRGLFRNMTEKLTYV